MGGSVVPKIFWRFLQKGSPDFDKYTSYFDFKENYTSKKETLEEFLEIHKMVEKAQVLENLPYFIERLVRGAYTFENLAYLELRYTPYLRTDRSLTVPERLQQMWEVVDVVSKCTESDKYPIIIPQIVCLHSSLPKEINGEMLKMAIQHPDVCAIDVAGSDRAYMEKKEEFVDLFKKAKESGLKTTGHLYETKNGCDPDLLPYLDRIGHGIQIPLRHPELLNSVAYRGQCLEVCPTSYLKTGTIGTLFDVREVFERCFDKGVDIAVCTDNPGLHNVRLTAEYEKLLTDNIVSYEQLEVCQHNSFKHAFAWPHKKDPLEMMRERLIDRV